jgi:hypothetical protein
VPRTGAVVLAALLLAGCATTAPPRSRAEASETPRRCSTGDPDSSAWFCVVGRILYGALSSLQPINELTMR